MIKALLVLVVYLVLQMINVIFAIMNDDTRDARFLLMSAVYFVISFMCLFCLLDIY